MSELTVSVVTVVRNDRAGLERTRASIEMQDHGAWEHLIVDGASTDGTLELAETLATSERTRLLAGRAAGIYPAMNDGLASCTGDVVLYLNAGDYFTRPNALSLVTQHLQRSGRRWGYGPIQIVDLEGRHQGLLGQAAFTPFRLLAGHSGPPHQSTYVDRQLLVDLGGFDTRWTIVADWQLFARLALASPPCQWDDVLVAFNNAGVSTNRYRETWLQTHQARVDLLGLHGPMRWLSRLAVEGKIARVEVGRRAGHLKRRVLRTRP